jgi:hypothetical protein
MAKKEWVALTAAALHLVNYWGCFAAATLAPAYAPGITAGGLIAAGLILYVTHVFNR